MYVVDSNVLIDAKNRYYAFDIAPGFWQWLDHAHDNSLACSIESVRNELLEGRDELADWAREHQAFFQPVDEATTSRFRPLTQWANSQSYRADAINDFVSSTADYYLVAHAAAHGFTVVTLERSSPDSRKRVLIPDACNAMQVEFTNTFSMLRSTGAKLGLQLQ